MPLGDKLFYLFLHLLMVALGKYIDKISDK